MNRRRVTEAHRLRGNPLRLLCPKSSSVRRALRSWPLKDPKTPETGPHPAAPAKPTVCQRPRVRLKKRGQYSNVKYTKQQRHKQHWQHTRSPAVAERRVLGPPSAAPAELARERDACASKQGHTPIIPVIRHKTTEIHTRKPSKLLGRHLLHFF